MSKPNVAAIRKALPLSHQALRNYRPGTSFVCDICELEADPVLLLVWRECDERDRPIPGTSALVFIASDHKSCVAKMEKHPRLYEEVLGGPGHFPALCGPCAHRRGLACAHPGLTTNGGPGLAVGLSGLNAIVCARGGGCRVPLKRAEKCAGRTT